MAWKLSRPFARCLIETQHSKASLLRIQVVQLYLRFPAAAGEPPLQLKVRAALCSFFHSFARTTLRILLPFLSHLFSHNHETLLLSVPLALRHPSVSLSISPFLGLVSQGFQKVWLLPGQRATVRFDLTNRSVSTW